jgi:hypothetical protein
MLDSTQTERDIYGAVGPLYQYDVVPWRVL